MVEMKTPQVDTNFIAKDFDLLGVDGQHYNLDRCFGTKGLLVMFICNHCPYVKSIIKRLVHDAKILKSDFHIHSVAIMPNDTTSYPEDSYEKMKIFAKEHNFDFPYLIDQDQTIAKKYQAVCTPDFFGFNSERRLCYRGRFDSSGRNNSTDVNNKQSDLLTAMKFVSKTGKVPENQINSIGCSIKWASISEI